MAGFLTLAAGGVVVLRDVRTTLRRSFMVNRRAREGRRT